MIPSVLLSLKDLRHSLYAENYYFFSEALDFEALDLGIPMDALPCKCWFPVNTGKKSSALFLNQNI